MDRKAKFSAATLEAIANALAAAAEGDVGAALIIGEQALANGGQPGPLHALIGMMKLRQGDDAGALHHLERAHALEPQDAQIAANLAGALTRNGRCEDALGIVSLERAYADPSMKLMRIRGFLADKLGRLDLAVSALHAVVVHDPNDWQGWNNLGTTQLRRGDVAAAITSFECAARLEIADATPGLNLATAHRRSGNPGHAEALLKELAADFPSDPRPLHLLHDVLSEQLRSEEVGPILAQARALDPDNVELVLAAARHAAVLMEMDTAERLFLQALSIEPSNEQAFIGLAVLYEHVRPSRLSSLVEEGERAGIGDNAVNLLRAFAARRSKHFSDGLGALGDIDPWFEPARVEQLRGQMLEATGDFDPAFAAFERMNSIFCEDPSLPLERASALRDRLRAELKGTTRRWAESWSTRAPNLERREPAFLVGFPRSGTTLLDTLLMGHPEAFVLEERPILARLKEELGSFSAIANLSPDELRKAQQRYFEIAADYGFNRPEKQLVDKSPLLLSDAAIIHRLFPDALFILAMRHPADVLLSCYCSSFNLNDAMANFLKLDTAAEFYDLVMRSWENARSIFALNVHVVRYEDLVENPARVLRPLVTAMNLEWNEGMLNHQRTAAGRRVIPTASYAQVTEPIYRTSIGKWRRYRRHLSDVLPVLAPFAEAYGYDV